MSVAPGVSFSGRLSDVALGMSITADLSRSDLLLLRPLHARAVQVVAQARPHSISSLHTEDLVGETLTAREIPLIFDAFRRRRRLQSQLDLPSGAPVVQDVRPILDAAGQVQGLLSIETSLIQLEAPPASPHHVSTGRRLA